MSDSALLALASAGAVESYSDVSARLEAMQAALDASDGLVWFTRLYAAMSRGVMEAARRHHFHDPELIERLDCHVANLWFVALAAHVGDPGTGPPCWEPLLQSRHQPGILPIQYALAGLNAHLNRDLPVALVTTLLELDRAPAREDGVHGDYLKVGAILESALLDAREALLAAGTRDPELALAHWDHVTAHFSLRRARDAAWVAAEVRWVLRASPVIARHHLEALDRMVGFASRGLLLPLSHIVRAPSSRTGVNSRRGPAE